MASFWLDGALAVLTILSSLGSVLIFSYLVSTRRYAPKFLDSAKTLDTGPFKEPLLSIIITARNEEKTIGRCISSLLEQTYRNFELIVVDDSSSDGTFEIANEFQNKDTRVLSVRTEPRPQGWSGKSWPCWTGYRKSRGEILLFVDADSHFRNDAVELTVRYFEAKKYDIFSISPRVKLEGVWSRSTIPFLSGAINLLYPMKNVNDPKHKRAYVFGTFVLVRREVYEAIGGHEKVRDRLVEDAAIAFEAKSKGYRLRVEVGDNLIETEWESGFPEIFHGLERIFSDSIKSYGLLSALNSVLVFFIALFPLIVLVSTLVYLGLLGTTSVFLFISLIASAVGVGGILSTGAIELKSLTGKVGPYPLLFPLGASLFIAAIITSSAKIARGRPFEWKGGKYVQEITSKRERSSKAI
jgi:glycosyltransferase involved in cell wall biosynthesis